MIKSLCAAFAAVLLASLPAAAADTPASSGLPYTFPHITPEKDPLLILGPAGEHFTFAKTCKSTNGSYALATATIPSGAGPIPHVHHWTDEWFYFPDGGITLEMGDQRYPNTAFVPGANAPRTTLHLLKTKPGDVVYGPRYFVHGFFNDTSETHNIIFIWAPDDGIVDYFREVGQHVKSFAHVPPINEKNKELFVSKAPKYGINQASSYDQYVAGIDRTPMQMEMDPELERLNKLLTSTPATAPKVHIPCGK